MTDFLRLVVESQGESPLEVSLQQSADGDQWEGVPGTRHVLPGRRRMAFRETLPFVGAIVGIVWLTKMQTATEQVWVEIATSVAMIALGVLILWLAERRGR